MNDSFYKDLVEASWRRRLTPAEEAQLQSYLAIHPEKQAEWEKEAFLNDSLRQLPDAPLASNFTAQVMLAVERETAVSAEVTYSLREQLFGSAHSILRRFAPRFAATALVLVCSFFGVQQYQAYNQRQVTRNMVNTIGEVASVLPAEVLQDFDTINQLQATTKASDQDLLAVLEK